MTKYDLFCDLKSLYYRSTILSFFCSSKYTLFQIEILHVCGTHHWLHPDLFLEFFETQKYDFLYFFKKRDH